MEGLKKCPFCGGTAVFKTIGNTSTQHEVGIKFTIKCEGCGVRLPGVHEVRVILTTEGEISPTEDRRGAAVAEWNRRSQG